MSCLLRRGAAYVMPNTALRTLAALVDPHVDFILVGEPEMTLFALSSGKAPADVKGLAWLKQR